VVGQKNFSTGGRSEETVATPALLEDGEAIKIKKKIMIQSGRLMGLSVTLVGSRHD
jgi:hypothetical protein